MDGIELNYLTQLATQCKLTGRTLLSNDQDLVLKVCNGIGPQWFPESLRKMIDKLHPSLKVVAAIHDLWYYFGTGTIEDFWHANEAFYTNGVKVAKYLYSWYNPRRYIVEFDAKRFAKLCDVGGKFAYYAAIAERKNADENPNEDDEVIIEDLISGRRIGGN